MALTFPPNLAGVLSVASVLATASPALAAGGDRAFGEYLAGECTACHLVSGKQVGGIPAIVGLPEDAFIAMMTSYARKERENQVMRNIAAKFQPDELAALAAYFGSLKPR